MRFAHPPSRSIRHTSTKRQGFHIQHGVLVLSATLSACSSTGKETLAENESHSIIEGSASVADVPLTPSLLSDGRYLIKSATIDDACLTELNDSTVSITACNNDSGAARWTFSTVSHGTYWLHTSMSGNALDITDGGTASGNPIGTYSYGDGSKNRQFLVSDVGSNAVQFEVLSAPGMCLALDKNGGAVLDKCGIETSRWTLYPVTQSPTVGRGLASQGCVKAPALKIQPLTSTTIAGLGQPIDLNLKDLVGPDSWDSNYGKRPEFVTTVSGTGLDVFWSDQSTQHRGVVVHLEPNGAQFHVTRAWQVDLLDSVMGYAVGEDGIRYYATSVSEGDLISTTYPVNDIHRSNIVRLVGFDESGCVRLDVDLDLARGFYAADSAILINPMTAGTARLAYGGGVLALVHSANTQPDGGGTRHQMSRTTYVDVRSGEVIRTSTQWVSHSFDVREIWDGERFVELHLGDTFPRGLVLGRFGRSDGSGGYLPFRAKGSGNPTYTRLGGIVPISSGHFGWLTVFSTERSSEVTEPRSARDVALVRVVRDFEQLDSNKDSYVDTTAAAQSTVSGTTTVTNYVTWLTDYGTTHSATDAAERPRIVALGNDRSLITWEHWTGSTFDAVYGSIVDASGSVLINAKKIGTDHISRGDDAVSFGGKGALVTSTDGKLVVTLVSGDLTTTRIEVP
jgi:hypothetical protein